MVKRVFSDIAKCFGSVQFVCFTRAFLLTIELFVVKRLNTCALFSGNCFCYRGFSIPSENAKEYIYLCVHVHRNWLKTGPERLLVSIFIMAFKFRSHSLGWKREATIRSGLHNEASLALFTPERPDVIPLPKCQSFWWTFSNSRSLFWSPKQEIQKIASLFITTPHLHLLNQPFQCTDIVCVMNL
jgi:hypothetical protein